MTMKKSLIGLTTILMWGNMSLAQDKLLSAEELQAAPTFTSLPEALRACLGRIFGTRSPIG